MYLLLFFLTLCTPAPDLPEAAKSLSESNDTIKVQQLLDAGFPLEATDPDSAITIYRLALELSESLDYTIGAGRSLMYMGIVASDRGNYSEASKYFQLCLPYFCKINYIKGIGGTLINLGNISQFQGNYKSALDWYTRGIPYFERANDTASLIISYNNLGSVFSFLKQPDKSLSYYHQSLALSHALRDSAGIADSHINISKIERQQNKPEKAIIHLKKVISYAQPANNHYYLMLALNNLAELYITEGRKPDSALILSQMAVSHARQVNNAYYKSKAILVQGSAFNSLGLEHDAVLQLQEGIEMATRIKSKELLSFGYQLISESYQGMGDFKTSLNYLVLHKAYSDSIFNEKQTKSLNELEVKYQSEKKDRELAEQKVKLLENEELLADQRQFIIIAAAGIGTVLLIVIFLALYFRERQKSQRQQMLALQQASELKGIKAMVTGEEKERARLAKDLHDGLSGLLGMIKLRFSTFTESFAEPQKKSFSETLGLLDEANQEVRKISHNLMPELLLKYGLKEGLQNYFNNINASRTLAITFQPYGINGRLPTSLELTVYRIIQELIHNIIKHSKAKEALVQLTRNDNILTVTVEDNGKGFAPELTTNGAGLQSIKSRVQYLEGKLDINSDGTSGTSVYIELALNKQKKHD